MSKKPTQAAKPQPQPQAPPPQPQPDPPANISEAGQALLLRADNSHAQGAAPFMVAPADVAELVNWPAGPLVEFNQEMRDGDKIACRTTDAGRTMVETLDLTDDEIGATESEFEVEDGIPIPTLKRGGRQGPARVYPFASMGVGASFFIPATGDNPKPAKRIASIVSNATKAMAPKHFKVQAVTDKKKGAGARVWRMPDFTPTELAEREKASAENAAKKAAKEAAEKAKAAAAAASQQPAAVTDPQAQPQSGAAPGQQTLV